MNHKLVSCKVVIADIFSKLGNQMSNHNDSLTDMIEWIGEALEGIGSTGPLEKDLVHKAKVHNNKILLPCNLYLLQAVSHKGCYLPYGSQIFNDSIHCTDCLTPRHFTPNTLNYTCDNNWLRTNVCEGDEICIFYQGFATDKDGFPLIPDNYSYKRACFWYIMMNMSLGGFVHPDKSINFESCEARWLKYCTQAENSDKMFDIPRFETFKNQWLRLAPRVNRAENFFRELGTQESITHTQPFIW